MYSVVRYKTQAGNCPLNDFLMDLLKNKKEIELAQIQAYVQMLQENGYRLPLMSNGYAKHLQGKLYELRPGNNRVIYFFLNSKDQYVLLHAFQKKSKKTPPQEITRAIDEMKDYEKRMTQNEK
ncbi:MAG: type II toxin-antitoxin system RelE/ParE family toxin [Roseburia sp.]|nr:type II toxin-antitoxin system RelE/ParE family toxin [Anaeroplasma bactoclasticum]MCM1195478.1 type II toxin-antitoxin system RelE/ParE family toxin [Roseburia sp.]MCM1555956.1 type II toxin-antitoxin system RelE/ParE family toxin [Anaeroplasma bactoclasticum]